VTFGGALEDCVEDLSGGITDKKKVNEAAGCRPRGLPFYMGIVNHFSARWNKDEEGNFAVIFGDSQHVVVPFWTFGLFSS
jgi:hypothetical protein